MKERKVGQREGGSDAVWNGTGNRTGYTLPLRAGSVVLIKAREKEEIEKIKKRGREERSDE